MVLTRRATARPRPAGRRLAPQGGAWPSGRSRCPRAAGQSFDVAVLWLDTLLVAALIGPTAAGIYAAGTRFLLIGTFTAEAIQQAVAPRVSSLITLGKRDDAHAVITQATSWQAAITWPVYLVRHRVLRRAARRVRSRLRARRSGRSSSCRSACSSPSSADRPTP